MIVTLMCANLIIRKIYKDGSPSVKVALSQHYNGSERPCKRFLRVRIYSQLAWGHCLKIFDSLGRELGMVKECVLTFLPKFEVYEGSQMIGSISKELTFLKPRYNIDFNGWHIEGDWTEWNYSIMDGAGRTVAVVSKELFHMTDTYVLDIANPKDALHVLMFTLAVDAEKCSRQ